MTQPDFDMIARFYDVIYAHRTDDVEMWLDFADSVMGDILEIGCGTGRVTLPLLRAGFRVTGVDISELSLKKAAEKIAAAGVKDLSTLVHSDMRTFNLPQKNFALAFIPINTFMHNLSTADQRATLNAVAAHLQPEGIIVVDLYHPHPPALMEADGRVEFAGHAVDDETNHTVQWFSARRLQLDEQIQQVTFFLDEIDGDGKLFRHTLDFPMRYLHRFEMTLLLQATGFTVEEILGDYDQAPFYAESPRMIFVARKELPNLKEN